MLFTDVISVDWENRQKGIRDIAWQNTELCMLDYVLLGLKSLNNNNNNNNYYYYSILVY
jgi:hypothetical protein